MNITLDNINRQKEALLWAINDAFDADDLDRVDRLDDTLELLNNIESIIENRTVVILGETP